MELGCIEDFRMTGEESFITSIITQAIEDCAYTGISKKKLKFKMDAIKWIVEKDPNFIYYCKMLGLDPDPIRQKIIDNVDMSYTQNQKLAIKKGKKA